MKVNELTTLIDGTLMTAGGGENEIACGCTCDLLSWVMAHGAAGMAWVTVQTHMNVIAVASLMEMAAVMYETIDSREYETTRMQRFFQQSELRTELDTEVIRKNIHAIWITETGKIAVMLKNEQVMEMEV